jgi:hypothetical protein
VPQKQGQIVRMLPPPTKGVVRSQSRSESVPQSLISSLNIYPYGPWDGFKRPTVRPDVSVFANLSTSSAVQGLLPIGYVVQPGEALPPAPYYPWTGLSTSTSGGQIIAYAGTTTYTFVQDQSKPFSLTVVAAMSVAACGSTDYRTSSGFPSGPGSQTVEVDINAGGLVFCGMSATAEGWAWTSSPSTGFGLIASFEASNICNQTDTPISLIEGGFQSTVTENLAPQATSSPLLSFSFTPNKYDPTAFSVSMQAGNLSRTAIGTTLSPGSISSWQVVVTIYPPFPPGRSSAGNTASAGLI